MRILLVLLIVGFAVFSTPSMANIKRITISAVTNLIEDLTPQLGGNLDLNSNDITGTGDINITGSIVTQFDMPSVQATSDTFALDDLGTYKRYDGAGNLTATVPLNSAVAFPIGSTLFGEIFDGANTLTIVATAGVTITSSDTLIYTSAPYGLVKKATDTWTAVGGD